MAEQAMIHITMGAQSGDFASGTTAGQAIRAMLPAGHAERVLCAMQGGICVELSDPLTEDCVLEPLTYQDEEGRRVYERSLRGNRSPPPKDKIGAITFSARGPKPFRTLQASPPLLRLGRKDLQLCARQGERGVRIWRNRGCRVAGILV